MNGMHSQAMQALSGQLSTHTVCAARRPHPDAPHRGVVRRRCVHTAAAATSISLDPAAIQQPVQSLKEWAVTCSALGDGQQTILLRKGGVREGAFAPAAHAFLMFPTAFHSQTQLLKPGIAQRYEQEMALQPKAMETLPLHVFATVTGAWTTRDPGVLAALDALHVYAEGFLDARLKWRSKDPLTLLELRAYRLAEPLLLPVGQEPERYFGCFSWLELPAKVVAAGPPCWTLQPALSDAEFAERQAVLREALRQLDAQVLELSC